MKLSKRVQQTPASPIRKFAPLQKQAEESGKKVYRLNIGQPDLPTPKKITKTFKHFKGKIVLYAPSQGMPETVSAWQRYYLSHGIHVREEDIIVTMGGSEALLFSMLAVADPGDEIIVFEPFYPNFAGFAAMAGVKLIPITTDIDSGFALPPREEIEKYITDKTRAILVNNPNNPTGAVYTFAQLQDLVSCAYKNDLYIIADEVYREFIFNNTPVTSLLEFPEVEDRVIVIDSVSKRFNHCGGRVGCLVSRNKDINAAILKFGQARLSVPTLEQLSVIPLLNSSKEYTESVRDKYRVRRDIVFQELSKIDGVVCTEPQGAFYITAQLPIEDAEDFVAWLLTDFEHNGKTVMVTPGAGLYMTEGKGKNEVRIAFVLSEDDLRDAMEVFKKGLDAYLLKK